jgi:uncharacterized membrane protein YfcA
VSHSLLPFLIGLVTGFASGLMGIGGASLGTPLLRLIAGAPPLIALATPMPVMLPSSLSGGFAYLRQHKIDFRLAGWTLVTALPCTWIGAAATAYVPGQFLMVLTALFLIGVGSSFLIRSVLFRAVEEELIVVTEVSVPKALIFGTLGGLLAGLLAIGGGIIYVPVFARLFSRSMKVALATSLAIVTVVAIPGSIEHALLGHIDWQMAGLMTLGALPASFFGARLALRLRNQTLERIFGAATICFGVFFLFTQL